MSPFVQFAALLVEKRVVVPAVRSDSGDVVDGVGDGVGEGMVASVVGRVGVEIVGVRIGVRNGVSGRGTQLPMLAGAPSLFTHWWGSNLA